MNYPPSVFLSASVPDGDRLYAADFDPLLIKEAVLALIEVILGRFHLVWGGQPAITPMIWEASKRYSVNYADAVTLYQSEYFEGKYPEDNVKFGNVRKIPEVPGSQSQSLKLMREIMLSSHKFVAGVFIGGMEGVADEYNMFHDINPEAKLLPVPSPGGISRNLFQNTPDLPLELGDAIDFTYWFYRLLEVDLSTPRMESFKE